MTYHILYNPLAGGGMIPTPLQIDGETILGVSRYSVSAEANVEKKAAAAAK